MGENNFDPTQPQLVNGTLIEFDQEIKFGDFKAKIFYVFDHFNLKFRVGGKEGALVKIVSVFFSIYNWKVIDMPATEEAPVEEITPEPVVVEKPVFEPPAAIVPTYQVASDGQLMMF